MAKQIISTTKTNTNAKTIVSVKPKSLPGTSETNGSKRCPNCGKFMR